MCTASGGSVEERGSHLCRPSCHLAPPAAPAHCPFLDCPVSIFPIHPSVSPGTGARPVPCSQQISVSLERRGVAHRPSWGESRPEAVLSRPFRSELEPTRPIPTAPVLPGPARAIAEYPQPSDCARQPTTFNRQPPSLNVHPACSGPAHENCRKTHPVPGLPIEGAPARLMPVAEEPGAVRRRHRRQVHLCCLLGLDTPIALFYRVPCWGPACTSEPRIVHSEARTRRRLAFQGAAQGDGLHRGAMHLNGRCNAP